jgi:hypothetical protein
MSTKRRKIYFTAKEVKTIWAIENNLKNNKNGRTVFIKNILDNSKITKIKTK